MPDKVLSRERYGEAFWRKHHEAFEQLRPQLQNLQLIGHVFRLVRGDARRAVPQASLREGDVE
jgi:hypothetical protein